MSASHPQYISQSTSPSAATASMATVKDGGPGQRDKNAWNVSLCCICCYEPCSTCYGYICTPCVARQQRLKVSSIESVTKKQKKNNKIS